MAEDITDELGQAAAALGTTLLDALIERTRRLEQIDELIKTPEGERLFLAGIKRDIRAMLADLGQEEDTVWRFEQDSASVVVSPKLMVLMLLALHSHEVPRSDLEEPWEAYFADLLSKAAALLGVQ